ncbi:carbonic anhydrase 13-like [Planococcus citri]|uniref:carbonic anhydrase 13-like n=1 Tax=Planococcus citri TaxID=170843 RepID=UPI0031FA061B
MYSYICKNWLIFSSIIYLTFGGFSNATIGRFLPFSGLYPIPLKTPGPINIEVSEVKNITTFPVILLVNGYEKAFLKNTGYSAEVFLNQAKTSNLIIGGVLGINLYVLEKIRFYWAGSFDGISTNSVNGKNGTPLEVYIYYYNVKYGSLRNAFNFRNGVVQLTFRIFVKGSIPNPAFTPLVKTFKKIQKAGSTTDLLLLDAFQFYLHFPPTTHYFVYPGAYGNESTGASYSCATVIVTSLNPTHFISKQQFRETFLSLLDYNEKPLINRVEQVPVGRRPVVQSRGILKIPNLVKIPSILGH